MNSPRRSVQGRFVCALALALLAACTTSVEPLQGVASESGDIIGVTRSGTKIALTHSGRDIEPVLAPNGRVVVFSREGQLSDEPSECPTGMDASPPYAHDELWAVSADGSVEQPLVRRDPVADPDWTLCTFQDKQFSSDSRLVYFMAQGGATAGALHVYDFAAQKRKLLTYGLRFFVLDRCARPEYVDSLVMLQHDYFLFGGSYYWWWVLAPDGERIGPLGPDPSELEYDCKIKLPLER